MSQEITCSTRFSLHLCTGHTMCVEAKGSDVSKSGPKATPTTPSLPHQGKACSPRLAITGHAS
ncbi:hypothetical protein TIFTF001_048849 [Ficus carica]|uniref:Uncharacterized protein n=1 Tax=Ficus carica TaxID=3494 RepID=A0AA87YXC4_FICCA|nr:hypothetical protein TIFTF001_048842 [Ficus carica]GMN21189.1 hypothetical protein TIFTF001_048844 [Ficus carica]GMN21199.1 hypothetical protein TIFTF001_048847 [Ficus carica]GMN21207.1 hypothetical protein TIFTF001_048849 [Ficus carica]